jgi:hypothetical protein
MCIIYLHTVDHIGMTYLCHRVITMMIITNDKRNWHVFPQIHEWCPVCTYLCIYHPASGANPTIVIYNARVVNFYNATGSLARFENKNILFCFEKRSSLLQRWHCSCKFKNRRIGSWYTDSNGSIFVKLGFGHFLGDFFASSSSHPVCESPQPVLTLVRTYCMYVVQGCQFFLVQHTKTGEKVPNGHKIYQMATKYTNIFHFKPSKNFPNWDFYLKYIYHLATLTRGP